MLADRKIPAIYRVQPVPDDDLGWTEERGRDPVYIFEAVRKLKKAGISLQPDRHFGLGVKAYCQVTSPLRRYSDLIMQRQLHSVLTTGVSRYSDGDLLALMSVADQTSGIIKRICDDAEDYWALAYLEQNPGLVVQAVVLSTDRRSPLVLLTEYDVQARINPRREVSDGQRIALQVVHAQPRTGTLVLKEAD
jgi:exoribonuclease-2